MRTPDQLEELFRSSGRKVTPQRRQIFEILQGNPTHPTAEAVHAQVLEVMPTVSLRTVYATLHELAELGEVGELSLGTGATRFDPNVGAHHHLVCRDCGRVDDLVVDFPDVVPPRDQTGFIIDATEIVFRGRCAACAVRSESSTQDPTRETAASA